MATDPRFCNVKHCQNRHSLSRAVPVAAKDSEAKVARDLWKTKPGTDICCVSNWAAEVAAARMDGSCPSRALQQWIASDVYRHCSCTADPLARSLQKRGVKNVLCTLGLGPGFGDGPR